MKTPLALAALFVLSSAAAAAPSRREYIGRTGQDLERYCAEVAGFKIITIGPTYADIKSIEKMAMKQTEEIKAKDADMGDWKEVQKDEERKLLRKARAGCKALLDDDAGLPRLAKADADLSKIEADDWDKLSDNLGYLLEKWQGHDAVGNDKYPDSFKATLAGKHPNRPQAIYQLMRDSDGPMTELIDQDVLRKAVDVAVPKPAPKK